MHFLRLPFVFIVFAFSPLWLSSCGSGPSFKVSHFHLREKPAGKQQIDPLRAESNFRLAHTLAPSERFKKNGHYYNARWHLTALELGPQAPALTVRFQYRQPATGRTPTVMTKSFSASEKGKVAFEVIGENHRKKGRVLAWKMTLSQGQEILGAEQSFLWD